VGKIVGAAAGERHATNFWSSIAGTELSSLNVFMIQKRASSKFACKKGKIHMY